MAIIYGTAGGELLDGTDFDDFMQGFEGPDFIQGYAGNDFIYGGDGNDIIYGGSGADIMKGGAGDDTYFSPDDQGDVIIEAPGEGYDQVYSYSISYALPANVEGLSLVGANSINGTGNRLDNFLDGNSNNNTLIGGAGNDNLNGYSGADTMKGGTGDDNYYVDDVGDVVFEKTGEGFEWVITSINYVLGVNVEGLLLSGTDAINGTGNGLNNYLQGNANNNTLIGGAGNDVIYGGRGADIMKGGTGNDVFLVDNVGDLVNEILEHGIDVVNSSVNYVLPANVEYLALTRTNAINGTGNGLDNYLIGNDGNNILKGRAGNDIISGGMGFDKLSGGIGADQFIFNAISDSAVGADRDIITDFSHVQLDLIDISAIDSDDSLTGDQAFTFIGSAAFSAAGQLRYDASKGIIQGNVNSTLTPDFEIKLTGAPVVDATDFVL